MTTVKMRIGERWIGDGEPCFIIAEAGSNHDGNLVQAKALIDVAVEAGADAVKFQTFKSRTMYPRVSGPVEYLKALGVDRSISDLIEEMEMPEHWIPELAAYCTKHGIVFLSTPFDEQMVDLLDPYVPAFKIASYELTHIPMIRHAAAKKKPLIVSTGAGSLDEIEQALAAITAAGNESVCLMQCTAKYPAPPETVNVRVIAEFRQRWRIPVGLSDHSRHPLYAPLAAVACGASLIEKHYTLSRRLPGPDHSFALEPPELREMVEGIRSVERVLGNPNKRLLEVEQELVNYRRAIYTARVVEAGHVLKCDDLIVLRRPGTREAGIPPKELDALFGRQVRRRLEAQWLLTRDDLEPAPGA